MNLIAFDYGEKRIGVAVTDERGRITTSLPYISNHSELKKISKKDFSQGTDPKIIAKARKEAKAESKIELKKVYNKIYHLLNTYYPEKIIFGLPLSFYEKENKYIEGKQAQKVRKFTNGLKTFLTKQNIVCDLIFIEESMSSKIAEENLKEMGLSHDKIRERIDSESARIMVESYLSSNTKDYSHSPIIN